MFKGAIRKEIDGGLGCGFSVDTDVQVGGVSGNRSRKLTMLLDSWVWLS